MRDRLRILVVEDEPMNRLLIQNFLNHAGYAWLEAENGVQGLALAREHRPDVVLLDRRLPDMDGKEAAMILKADPATRHIPVIAVTGLAYDQDYKDSYTAGFDGHIAKPFHWRELISMIEKLTAD